MDATTTELKLYITCTILEMSPSKILFNQRLNSLHCTKLAKWQSEIRLPTEITTNSGLCIMSVFVSSQRHCGAERGPETDTALVNRQRGSSWFSYGGKRWIKHDQNKSLQLPSRHPPLLYPSLPFFTPSLQLSLLKTGSREGAEQMSISTGNGGHSGERRRRGERQNIVVRVKTDILRWNRLAQAGCLWTLAWQWQDGRAAGRITAGIVWVLIEAKSLYTGRDCNELFGLYIFLRSCLDFLSSSK